MSGTRSFNEGSGGLHRINPGDVCLLIGGHPKDIGKTMTALRKLSILESRITLELNPNLEPYWEVDKALLWITRDRSALGRMPYAPQSALMPIRPEPDPEERTAEQAVSQPRHSGATL